MTLAGLAVSVDGAHMAWGEERSLRELQGIPFPAALTAMKVAFMMDAAGTIAVLGLTIWAFFGLKKWAKN